MTMWAELVFKILDNYRSMVVVFGAIILGFPIAVVIYLTMERAGVIHDQYTKQHYELSKKHNDLLTLGKSNADNMEKYIKSMDSNQSIMMQFLAQNQTLMLKSIYISEGDCLNKSKTKTERNNCRPPVDYDALLSRDRR